MGPATQHGGYLGDDRVPRSTKAGPVGPATPGGHVAPAEADQRRSTKAGPVGSATRDRRRRYDHRDRRSTKAGPVGPATLSIPIWAAFSSHSAQRRPARWGRQPMRLSSAVSKAAVDAQRRPARWGRQPRWRWSPRRSTCWRPLNEGRPGGAGNPRTAARRTSCPSATLNEGRPGGAGNPRGWSIRAASDSRRSTKAGPVGPATPTNVPRWMVETSPTLNEGRPGGAGNPRLSLGWCLTRSGAQRRPAR